MTCAFAVRGALKKLQGVESVDVSLNKGLATVKLKPGNSLAAEQFWEVIQKNGYTPKDTRVVVRGDVVLTPSKVQLKVTGANRIYDLVPHAASPKALEDIKRLAGNTLTVEGTLVPGKDVRIPVPLQLEVIRP